MDIDISPVPRSREENQERAFIAASRRKDRSLDARIESANRASLLHKKRTGKALHITKEIVEKEAMYEEVDERYQEKRIRMLQAQNMQIEEEFHRHLLAAFAARANSVHSANSRRPSAVSARLSTAAGGRKMSLDLSTVRNPFADGMQNGPQTSPLLPVHGFHPSPPISSYEPSPSSSYVESPASSLTHGMPVTGPPHIPAYLTHTTFPAWPTQVPQSAPPFGSWHGFPITQAGDTQSVESWQQSLMQDAHLAPDASSVYQVRQYRDRLASAPELAMHGMGGGPSPTMNNNITWIPHQPQHTRIPSDPASLATPGMTFISSSSGASSPKFDMVSTQTLSTPEFCPTPNTAYSPGISKMDPVVEEKTTTTTTTTTDDEDGTGGGGLLVFAEELDPDYDEFSRFAFGLDSNSQLHQSGNGFGFDDIVTFDDCPTAAVI